MFAHAERLLFMLYAVFCGLFHYDFTMAVFYNNNIRLTINRSDVNVHNLARLFKVNFCCIYFYIAATLDG